MARVCELTGKKPIVGNKVSHSNIKTKRRFLPNLQKKRYFLAEEDKWVVMKVSSEAIRTINKNGLYATVKAMRAAGSKIDRKSTRLNSSHRNTSRMPSSA